MAKKVNSPIDNPNRLLSRSDKLWVESTKCRSCDVVMVKSKGKKTPQHRFTVQHNSPRYYPGYSADITIWCHSCNQADNSWKIANKIVSIHDFISLEIHYKLHYKITGNYVIDNVVYEFVDNKIIKIMPYFEWKFEKLAEWFEKSYFFKETSFEEYCNISWYTIKHYHMGGGWYAYKRSPSVVKQWKYINE